MTFKVPPLPYEAAAFAPHMSAETFAFHHGKHHQAYVDKTNELAKEAGKDDLSLVDLIGKAKKGPLFNNAAQLWNHSFFWQCLSPDPQKPSKALQIMIDDAFGSTAAMTKAFAEEATEHFGSGWAWLVLKGDKLAITSLHDADTPVAHDGMKPLFTLDVWEHAYYIDYRNERPKFIDAVLKNCVNWDFVAENLDGKGASRADQG
jgi:superoxide dismutase, Fe-Mn family